MTERDNGRERMDIGTRIIAFIGPEGSGKTTVACRLAAETGKPYLTTGEILRDLAANDPGHYGEEARKMFASHTYLDGKLLLQILKNRFSKEDTKNGFVLDGGFRTVEETRDFLTTLTSSDRNFPLTVVKLEIPDEVCFERLVTGENARKRFDDTKEALKSRLEKYHDRLEERLLLIGENPNWQIIEIDATPPIEAVYASVKKQILVPPGEDTVSK